MTYLLDSSVLIALTVAEHEHHGMVSAWAARIDRFAVCPVVEGALIRFLVRIGESAHAATEVLKAIHAMPDCDFWPGSMSYLGADLGHVRGHRQVTDAYLASLAGTRANSKLATLDEGLAKELPDQVVLVPLT